VHTIGSAEMKDKDFVEPVTKRGGGTRSEHCIVSRNVSGGGNCGSWVRKYPSARGKLRQDREGNSGSGESQQTKNNSARLRHRGDPKGTFTIEVTKGESPAGYTIGGVSQEKIRTYTVRCAGSKKEKVERTLALGQGVPFLSK